MKFEAPTITIKKFELENIVTISGSGDPTQPAGTVAAAQTALTTGDNAVDAKNIVTFTF